MFDEELASDDEPLLAVDEDDWLSNDACGTW